MHQTQSHPPQLGTTENGKICWDIIYKFSAKNQLNGTSGLEISQNKICGGEFDSCKFDLNKNTLLFSIDVIGSYFMPC